jgi:hypothetical protein
MTPSFAFGSSIGSSFAFFCDNRLMFDIPATAFLSLSHSHSFCMIFVGHSRNFARLQFDPPGWSFFPQPRPCVTVALTVCVPSPLLRIR